MSITLRFLKITGSKGKPKDRSYTIYYNKTTTEIYTVDIAYIHRFHLLL